MKEEYPQTIHVAITDDDQEIRKGLSWIIDRSEGFTCVGSYGTGTEALEKIEDEPPDVMLMDIGLPDMSGIECTARIKTEFPFVQVLMLTVYSEADKIFESLRAGAVGYILKKTPPAKLLEAIHDACSGGVPMSGEVARKVLAYFQKERQESDVSGLSGREAEVLELLIEGHSYKAIADKLFLSTHTVRFHLHNIYAKLHVSTRAEAVAKATRIHR
jgi:DNA-binding NarL/FixJ family response regulator